jgi:hypothetical protein
LQMGSDRAHSEPLLFVMSFLRPCLDRHTGRVCLQEPSLPFAPPCKIKAHQYLFALTANGSIHGDLIWLLGCALHGEPKLLARGLLCAPTCFMHSCNPRTNVNAMALQTIRCKKSVFNSGPDYISAVGLPATGFSLLRIVSLLFHVCVVPQ